MHLPELTEGQRRLAEQHLDFVPYILQKYFGRNVAMDEDMVSIGNLALCNAAARFDPELGHSFTTYAGACIRNAIRNEGRSRFSSRHFAGHPLYSLNSILSAEDGDEDEFLNLIPDESRDPADIAMDRILCDIARPLIPTYRQMVEDGLNLREIAKRERRTQQAIHIRIDRELRRARRALEEPIRAA